MGYYNNYISIDIDPEEVLDKMNEDALHDYVIENKIVTSSDFTDIDISDNLESAANTIEHKDLYTFLVYCRNAGIGNIPRTKAEMKEWINDIIDQFGSF